MSTKTIDLHVHSTASDGTYTPSDLIKLAFKSGLSAIAITDHDTIDGLGEAQTAANSYNIEFVPGVELSTEYNGKELHMVGLFIDKTYKPLLTNLKEFIKKRDERNKKIVSLLQKEGSSITFEKLLNRTGGTITRAHFADYLIEEGFVKDKKEAFSKYLGDGKRCFVERSLISSQDAIALIKEAGGTAIFAHPGLCKYTDAQLREALSVFKEAGLDGLEAVYSTYNHDDELYFTNIANEYNLLLSGGSDFHGSIKPDISLGIGRGAMSVPYKFLETIKLSRVK